jgi:hypothetical protein
MHSKGSKAAKALYGLRDILLLISFTTHINMMITVHYG